MAFVSIKKGKVTRHIEGKGFVIVESYTKRDGTVEDTEYVVWSDTQPPAIGSVWNLSGGFTHKHDEARCKEYGCSLSVRLFKIEPVLDDAPF